MLIEFTVQNYRSFSERSTLSMERTSLRGSPDISPLTNYAHECDLDLLRVAGIFGPNASGKSNLIKALVAMITTIKNSSREGQVGDSLPGEPFRLSPAPNAEPSFFEIIFVVNKNQYRYGFETTKAKIHKEWLYKREQGKAKETRLFQRNEKLWKFHPSFGEGKELRDKTRENALHLSVCAQFNGPTAKELISYIDNIRVLNGLHSEMVMPITLALLKNPKYNNAINILIKSLDLNISSIEAGTKKLAHDEMTAKLFNTDLLKKLQEDGFPQIQTNHSIINKDDESRRTEVFEITDESDGTQKLIAFSGPIIEALTKGHVLIIDEFDARLHTLMAKELIKLFQSTKSNLKCAQLIFTSHDVQLISLDLFRRDQIWFIQKRPSEGSSELYSLAEFKDSKNRTVRKDLRIDKSYMNGRFGAIPFISDLDERIASDLFHVTGA